MIECMYSNCSISGGSPYPRMDGRKIANVLQEGYRMPKPQHVDDKLYETLVFLSLSFLSDAISHIVLFILL